MSRAKENPFGRSGRRKNRPGAAWWGLQFLLSQVEPLLKAPQGQAATRRPPLAPADTALSRQRLLARPRLRAAGRSQPWPSVKHVQVGEGLLPAGRLLATT